MTTNMKTHKPNDVSFGRVFQLMLTNAIPVYCLLREMVQNGIDANLRYAEECMRSEPALYRPDTRLACGGGAQRGDMIIEWYHS